MQHCCTNLKHELGQTTTTSCNIHKCCVKNLTIFLSQQHATCRNRVAKREQHVAPNNVGCWDMLCWMLRSFGRGLTLELPQGGIFMASIGRNEDMSRNLARQISRDLHSNCFAMVFIIAGFYCDSRAHNFRKARVVKYIVVYGQIKAAAQKYCHNQRWRRKLKEVSFRTLPGFWRQFRWFFAEIS